MWQQRRRTGLLSSFCVTALGCLCASAPGAGELTMQQQRGRQLFFKGAVEGEAAPHALIGLEGTKAPATLAPCANCHGDDAHGGAEGALAAPDIGWRSLTNPVGHIHRNGRRHGPFSDQSFARAVTQGVDPSGGRLDAIMPRYDFTPDQIDALIEYLKVVDADQSPGVTNDSVRIGVLLPKALVSRPVGQSVLAILARVFDTLNSAGGIFGRRIETELVDPEDLSRSDARTRDLFALLDPSLAPAPQRSPEARRTPLIAATPASSRYDADPDPSSFYVLGGVRENIDVLLAYLAAQSETKRPPLAVIRQIDAASADASRIVARLSGAYGWPAPLSVAIEARDFDASGIVERLQVESVAAVVFLGDAPALYSLLRAADARAWRPYFLLPIPAVDGSVFAVPPTIAQRLLLAYPASDADQSEEFNQVRSASGRHAAAERGAYCITQILIVGLKDAGRDLGVRRFISAVEKIKALQTGVTRPLSFGPERRIGAPGAYVVGLDVAARRFIRLSEWLEAGEGTMRNAR